MCDTISKIAILTGARPVLRLSSGLHSIVTASMRLYLMEMNCIEQGGEGVVERMRLSWIFFKMQE